MGLGKCGCNLAYGHTNECLAAAHARGVREGRADGAQQALAAIVAVTTNPNVPMKREGSRCNFAVRDLLAKLRDAAGIKWEAAQPERTGERKRTCTGCYPGCDLCTARTSEGKL